MNFKKKQEGVALLTILLMVVIISVLVTTMIAKKHKMVKETAILLRNDVMLSSGMAGEAYALAILQEDLNLNKTDSVKDVWAKKDQKFAVDTADLIINIKDLSGKYNINNLHYAGKVNAIQKDYFIRLLQQLGLENSLADIIIDWQDFDNKVTGKESAERDFYATENTVPSNQDFHSLQELINLKGMSKNALQALKPYIMVVPRYTKININMAEMPVITALDSEVDASTVLKTLEIKDKDPNQYKALEKVSDLFTQPAFSKLSKQKKENITPLLAIESNVFVITTKITIDERESYLHSYVYRNTDEIVVYKRNFSHINSQPE